MKSSGAVPAHDLNRLRVLVVDDEAPMRDLLSRMLGRLKVGEVVAAASGAEAFERFAGGRFDVVLVDWNMPEMSGLEFFQRVHAQDPALPFVMVTGRSDARSIAAARNSGIDAYVVKPISQGELKAKLAYVLGRRS